MFHDIIKKVLDFLSIMWYNISMNNKLKSTDSVGRYRTLSLFWEWNTPGDKPALFTNKAEDIVRDNVTYKSMKKLYMSYEHAPGLEYDFAIEVLGSWEHWQKVVNGSKELQEMIKDWQHELDIRLKAQGIKAIMRHSLDDDPKGLQAAKYLVEKGYAKRAGRPSKEEIERELKTDAKAAKDRQADLERIGLKVVNGKDS
jgi:hypothetical protein